MVIRRLMLALIAVPSLACALDSNVQEERDKLVDDAKRIRYFHGISVAEKSLDLGAIRIGEKRLLKLDSKLRSWEWNALTRRTRAELQFLIDEKSESDKYSPRLFDVAFLPGKPDVAAFRFTTGLQPSYGDAGKLTLWDSENGEKISSFSKVHWPFAINPDAQLFAAAESQNGIISIRDLKTGQVKTQLPDFGRRSTRLVFSSDGKQLSVSYTDENKDGQLVVWDIGASNVICRSEKPLAIVEHLGFSPDGRHLVTVGTKENELIIWNTRTGEQENKIASQTGIKCITFDPKNNLVWSDGRKIFFSNIDTGETKQALSDTGVAKGISPQLVNSIKPIKKDLVRLRGVDSIAISPDGHFIAIGYEKTGSLRLVELETGQEVLFLRGEIGTPTDLAFDAGGRRLAWSGGSNGISICELDKLCSSVIVPGYGPVDVSPDGNLISWCDGQLHVAKARNGQLIRPPVGNVRFGPLGVAFTHDGKRVAGGNVGGSWKIPVWDLKTGEQTVVLKNNGPAYGICFSADDRLALIAGSQSVRVCDVLSGDLVFRPKSVNVKIYCGSFSADGKFVATGGLNNRDGKSRGEVVIWDIASWEPVRTLTGLHGGATSVVWDRNCSLVAACAGIPRDDRSSRKDNPHEILVWDARTGDEKLRLEGHAAEVNAVLFTPDSQRLISASSDSTVKIWDVQTGLEIMSLSQTNDPLISLAISNDGGLLVAGGVNSARIVRAEARPLQSRICIWFAPPFKPVPMGREYPFLEISPEFNFQSLTERE